MHPLLAPRVARLVEADARDELLVAVVERRFRSPAFAPVERVWRLGALLLGRGGTLYAAGEALRVDELRHDNHQSNLAALRRELRSMALKAGVEPGDTIDYDAVAIDLDGDLADPAGPVIRTPDGLGVRWSRTSDALTPLETYLDERIGLLVEGI